MTFRPLTKKVTAGFVALQAVLVVLAITDAVPAHYLKPISISAAVLYAAFLIIQGVNR